MRRSQFLLLIFSLSGLAIAYFLSLNMAVSDAMLMPLDDAYIHFQYARQLAEGHPFEYNTGDDPTSGATSFLYSPLLALGYGPGFTGLNLGYWAIFIGVVMHLGSVWLVWRLLTHEQVHVTPSQAVLTLAYGISGAFVWAALSGMETMLFVFVVLLTLHLYQRDDRRGLLMAAALCALIRPEGMVIALSVAGVLFLKERRFKSQNFISAKTLWLALPIIAVAVQPLLNLAVTGSLSASGNLAKSILYNPTIPISERIAGVVNNYGRFWLELTLGYSAEDGWYIPVSLSLPAVIALALALRRDIRARDISPELLALIWIAGIAAMIATLDTAFWHFKRYQLPLLALLFPVGGWFLLQWEKNLSGRSRLMLQVVLGIILLGASNTSFIFAGHYHDNLALVHDQQLAMAEWVEANIPDDARLAVHDVGMMGYVSNRTTYDVVGLTSSPEDIAAAWRQGPGTLYEVMAAHPQRPDYFAIYPDVLGVPFLVQAGVLGDELARFEVDFPPQVVASATEIQVVAPANWDGYAEAASPQDPALSELLEDLDPIVNLSLGNLAQEAAQGYTWTVPEGIDGFPTEVRRLSFVGSDTQVIDGGRVITDREEFDLQPSDEDYLVVVRVHANGAAALRVGCDEVQERGFVPSLPGTWVEIPFVLPASTERFCIETDDTYYPTRYWVYTGDFSPDEVDETPLAQFIDPALPEGRIDVLGFDIQQNENQLNITLRLATGGDLAGDGKVFLHLYDDLAAGQIAQADGYVNGSVPPANWLAGVVEDEFVIADIPSGTYTLALGFYVPADFQRYGVQSDQLEHEGGRLFLDTVTVP